MREEALDWTLDRIQTLSKPEVRQLRANAERLHETGVVALCDKVLDGKSGQGARKAGTRPARHPQPRKGIPR